MYSQLVGYVVEYKPGVPCYMTLPEFEIANRLDHNYLAWGLYTQPQRGQSGRAEVLSAGGDPLYRGPMVRPASTEDYRAYPALVVNHLLLYRPELCPACYGKTDSFCKTCGHGSHN